MTDTERSFTRIDDSKPGSVALHEQAARLETALERLRYLTEPDALERATLVARLEKLLPDED